jgi:hypothetical protein
MMNGGDLYELAKILGHSKSGAATHRQDRKHGAEDLEAKWKGLATRRTWADHVRSIVRVTETLGLWLPRSALECGGQGRNRTADASLFRAALYRLSYLAACEILF